MMEKAANADSDAITFDLEDAVRPEDRPAARENLRAILAAVDFGTTEIATRINAVGTDDWRADLETAVEAGVDTVTVPSVETPEAVVQVVSAVRRLTDEPPELILLLESPEGVFDGRAIAAVAGRHREVTALSFGVGDYARATGGEPTSDRIREFLNHRIVGFAAIGGLQPISSVFPDVNDTDRLRVVAERAVELGFVGQSVIHPDQVAAVNEVFTPDDAAVDAARAHVAAYEASDRGAFVHDGVFLDEAIVERYRRLVARAEALGARS